VLTKEEERGKRRGQAVSMMPFIGMRAAGEGEGGPGRSPHGRETGGERGPPSTAVDSRHRPVADGHERAARAHGATPSRGGRALMSGPRL
jgi:hypothetical protein